MKARLKYAKLFVYLSVRALIMKVHKQILQKDILIIFSIHMLRIYIQWTACSCTSHRNTFAGTAGVEMAYYRD